MGDDMNYWTLIYVFLVAVFALGELATPGSFILAPFAVGSIAGAIASSLVDGPAVPLTTALVVSILTLIALRPLARHLDQSVPETTGVGANRLVGMVGIVLQDIPAQPGQTGMVKMGGEQWRASTGDQLSIPTGVTIRVLEVSGTRLIVEPDEDQTPSGPRQF